jgi:8-oxo-dGTP pyrophosphatase MutT (NUDIX family)
MEAEIPDVQVVSQLDLPLLRRSAVRLVITDADRRVLLFQIREPEHPAEGLVWELPGGGIDPGETYLEAAIRELAEETGIVAEPSDVGQPTWRRRVTFKHAGARRLQDEVVVLVRLHEPEPIVDERRQLPDELETFVEARWWSVAEVEASAERFFPGRLPSLLRRFLDGEQIEEPFEHFS